MKKIFYNFLYSISVFVLIVSSYIFCIRLFGFIISREFLPDTIEPFEGHGLGLSYTLFEKILPLLIFLAIAIISLVGVKKIPAANKKIGWIINICLIIIFLVFFIVKIINVPVLG